MHYNKRRKWKKKEHEYQNESDAEPKNDRKLYEKHERHYNIWHTFQSDEE